MEQQIHQDCKEILQARDQPPFQFQNCIQWQTKIIIKNLILFSKVII